MSGDPTCSSEEPAPASGEGGTRAFARVEATVQVSLQSDHNFWTGFTRDIGEGGVFVMTPDPPELGTVVHFQMALPGDPVVHSVVGVVRWVRGEVLASSDLPVGMGVKFVDLPENLRAAIQHFMDRGRDSLFFDDDLEDP